MSEPIAAICRKCGGLWVDRVPPHPCDEIARIKEEARRDYDGMRDMQRKFIEADCDRKALEITLSGYKKILWFAIRMLGGELRILRHDLVHRFPPDAVMEEFREFEYSVFRATVEGEKNLGLDYATYLESKKEQAKGERVPLAELLNPSPRERAIEFLKRVREAKGEALPYLYIFGSGIVMDQLWRFEKGVYLSKPRFSASTVFSDWQEFTEEQAIKHVAESFEIIDGREKR